MDPQLLLRHIDDVLREEHHPDIFFHSDIHSAPNAAFLILKDYMPL